LENTLEPAGFSHAEFQKHRVKAVEHQV